MNRVYGSFAAKAAAFVLMALFGIAAVFSLIGLDYLAENPDIDRCDSFFESSICRTQLKAAAQDVFRALDDYSGELDDYLYVWESYQQDWLGDVEFEIRTPEGELVLESMGSFPLEQAGHIHTMTGEDYVVKTYVAKDLPFSIGWVNLDKAMFDFCKLFGEWLMLYAALALIGAACCFVFLLRASGHRRDVEGVVLNSQDKVPLDVYLICAGMLIAVLVAIADEILASMPLYMIMPLFPIVFAGGYVVVFATLMTIVNRLKYGKFWENTLIWVWGGKALRLCLRLIKKLLSKLESIT